MKINRYQCCLCNREVLINMNRWRELVNRFGVEHLLRGCCICVDPYLTILEVDCNIKVNIKDINEIFLEDLS